VKPEDRVYWSKFLISIVIGLLSAEISASIEMRGVALLIIFLAAVVYVAVSKGLARVFLSEEARRMRRQVYLNGLGTYIGMFLVSWILTYNVLILAG